MRNGTSRVPYEKNEDSYVGSTPASTNMFEGDSDEEQASLIPTGFARHVNRSGTSLVPYERIKKGARGVERLCVKNDRKLSGLVLGAAVERFDVHRDEFLQAGGSVRLKRAFKSAFRE